MPNTRPIFEKLKALRQYSEFELWRYHRSAYDKRSYDRFFNRVLHALGTFRVVYDVKRKEWDVTQVYYNPLTWVIIFFLYFGCLLWGGPKTVVKDWKRYDVRLFPSVHERLDDGRARFLYRDAMFESPPNFANQSSNPTDNE